MGLEPLMLHVAEGLLNSVVQILGSQRMKLCGTFYKVCQHRVTCETESGTTSYYWVPGCARHEALGDSNSD